MFKARLHTMQVDQRALLLALRKAVEQQALHGARLFFRNAFVKVPFRTGFARGGFLNLMDVIQERLPINTAQTIARISRRRQGFLRGTSRVERYKGVLKNSENARQFSTRANDIFNWNGNVYVFKYGINIDYFTINDFLSNRRTPSAPWRSFSSGIRAFNNYIKRQAAKGFPIVSEYFIFNEHRVVETQKTVRKVTGTLPVVRRRN